MANGHRDVAEYLMEKTDRSVLELTNRLGQTALFYAAGIGQEDDEAMYKWLIEFGANENRVDEVGKV